MTRIAVVSGNKREFYYFFQEIVLDCSACKLDKASNKFQYKDMEYYYIGDVSSLRECYWDAFIYYGTYTNRKDLHDIKQEERINKYKH